MAGVDRTPEAALGAEAPSCEPPCNKVGSEGKCGGSYLLPRPLPGWIPISVLQKGKLRHRPIILHPPPQVRALVGAEEGVGLASARQVMWGVQSVARLPEAPDGQPTGW